MIPSGSPGRTTVYRIFFGGWTPDVFFGGCLCLTLFHKREGVVGCGEGSPPFSLLRHPFHGCGVYRQLHGRGLSSQHRGPSISNSQFHCPVYPQMVRTPPCPPGSPVHHGKSQCSGRLSLSPGPDPRVRMDSPHVGLSGAPPTMAGNDRPVCYLSKSPLLHLFLALLRSSGDGDGRSPTVLGPPPGLHVPSLGYDSTGPPQAPIIIRSCADSDHPTLASEALVSGSAGTSDRPAGNVVSSSGSPQPTPLSSSLSRSAQASSSCLATLQRFARAAGFSSRVAAQVGLARRFSFRTNYQLKWSVYRQWCRSVGHSISRPSLPKVADFLLRLHRSRKLSVSSVMGYRSMLATSSVSSSATCPLIRSCMTWFAPSGSKPPSDRYVLRPGTSLRCYSFLTRLSLNRSTGLLFVT